MAKISNKYAAEKLETHQDFGIPYQLRSTLLVTSSVTDVKWQSRLCSDVAGIVTTCYSKYVDFRITG